MREAAGHPGICTTRSSPSALIGYTAISSSAGADIALPVRTSNCAACNGHSMQPFSSQPSDSRAYSCVQTLAVAELAAGKMIDGDFLVADPHAKACPSATSPFAATRTQSLSTHPPPCSSPSGCARERALRQHASGIVAGQPQPSSLPPSTGMTSQCWRSGGSPPPSPPAPPRRPDHPFQRRCGGDLLHHRGGSPRHERGVHGGRGDGQHPDFRPEHPCERHAMVSRAAFAPP